MNYQKYALLVAALAVVGCIAYRSFEREFNAIVSNVTATLTRKCRSGGLVNAPNAGGRDKIS